MQPFLLATAAAAALSMAAPCRAQRAEAPLPAPQPPSPAQAAPAAQQPPVPAAEMPAARQGSTAEIAASMPPRHRFHHKRTVHAPHVNRALANAYTAELNRRELEALQSADTMPSRPRAAPWRELHPRR